MIKLRLAKETDLDRIMDLLKQAGAHLKRQGVEPSYETDEKADMRTGAAP